MTSLSGDYIIGYHSTLKKDDRMCSLGLSLSLPSKLFESLQQGGDTMAKTTQHGIGIPAAGRVPLSTNGWEGLALGLQSALCMELSHF